MIRDILSALTIGSHMALIGFGVLAWAKNQWALKMARKYGGLAAFIVALTALSGSLYFSEIAGYEPCKLCWFQRIFMYPLVLVLGIAVYKKDYAAKRYVVPMAIIGAVIAAYHYVSATLVKAAAVSCTLDGPSCFVDYFTDYGYVTIPMMALTAFMAIGILAWLWKK
jgi:hypothetical protein